MKIMTSLPQMYKRSPMLPSSCRYLVTSTALTSDTSHPTQNYGREKRRLGPKSQTNPTRQKYLIMIDYRTICIPGPLQVHITHAAYLFMVQTIQCPHCKIELRSERGLSIHLTRWCKAPDIVTAVLEKRRDRQHTTSPTPAGLLRFRAANANKASPCTLS